VVEGLDEHAARLVVAAALDRALDLALHLAPAACRRPAHGLVGELDAALDRRPAQRLRVDEVLRLLPPLPDTGVRILPALAHDVDELDDEAPQVVVRRVPAAVPTPGQVQQLAVC